TAGPGVEAYSADDPFGEWTYEGVVGTVKGGRNFWAPSIVKYHGKYYIYVSCDLEGVFEHMQVMEGDSPLGPFGNPKKLYNEFSIDSHVVETQAGLFLWYAKDNRDTDRIGTRVYIDRLLDPYTPANEPKEVVVPTFDEEIFMKNRYGDGKNWHTIEGAFWFREGDWQYVMYSGACYENDTYHIGYAAAKSDEADLTKVEFEKHTADGRFDPVMIKNDWEEGVGHHSVLQYKGEYYAVYHGRDIKAEPGRRGDRRTARICKLHVENGVITAERYEDRV
ncbi:MAG: family 43 glycosylhydrolase, partial [Clostridia bacterium]|nr:family 43 glycosylhydrolase [Clostridia bacterium]